MYIYDSVLLMLKGSKVIVPKDYCIFWSLAVESEVIARGTVGFSGAELENLVNQAALKAAVDGKDMVTMKELEFAKDKILMGRYL